jgi:biopolymer transport protein ExbB/TolQ
VEIFNQIIFVISSSLLIPVIVALAILFAVSLFHIGGFYGNYTDRMKFKKNIKPLLKKTEELDSKVNELKTGKHLLTKYLIMMSEMGWDHLHGEKLLSDLELDFQKNLEKPKILMRTGPMLGLMGTLIPMGPALAGLASGDISTMAINMQLAFSTTVIGIFIGLTGFIILEVQKRWAAEDYAELDYLLQFKSGFGADEKK